MPSIFLPANAPTFPPSASINCATVILFGRPLGEKITSGTIPLAVKGKSCGGTIAPTIPFCP